MGSGEEACSLDWSHLKVNNVSLFLFSQFIDSRFEEMCGAFSPWPSQEVGDEPILPTQHTVHARVQNHLDWIARNVFSEGSCG